MLKPWSSTLKIYTYFKSLRLSMKAKLINEEVLGIIDIKFVGCVLEHNFDSEKLVWVIILVQ